MAEERVVFTAELRDEASAPLGNLSNRVSTANRTVARSATDQADAVGAAARRMSTSSGTVGRDMNAMATAASSASGRSAAAVAAAANRVRDSSGRFLAAGRAAGEAAGEGVGSGMNGKLKGLLGGALAAFGVREAASMANGAVTAFSNLEDSSAAALTIYGENMAGITALSKSAGEGLGMNEAQVITAAQTYGVYGKAAGLAGKDLETFSTDLIGRAGDMASFFGKSPEQAIEAIGAAMRGEAEPIRAFGVMLDDATMRQKALEMGLISNTKEALEPQTKMLAAQALIMEKSSGVAGDFNNTMNSTANVQKRLQSATTNLSAKFGGLLAPMFTSVRLKALDSVNGMSAFLDKVKAAQDVLKGGGTNKDIATALGLSPAAAQRFSDFIGPFRAFSAAYREGGDEITSSGVAGVFEGVGLVLSRVVAGWSLASQGIKMVGSDIDPLTQKVYALRTRLGELTGAQWFVGIAGGAGLLLAAFGRLPPVVAPFMGLMSKLAPLVGNLGGALKFLLGPIGLISALLLYAYTTNEPFRTSINALVGTLLTLAGTLLTSLMPVFTTLITALLPVFSTLIATVLPLLVGLIGQLAPVFLQVVTAVLPLIPILIGQLVPVLLQMIEAVLPIVMQLLTTLAPIFTALIAAVMPLIPPIMEIVTTLLTLAMQVLTPLMPIISMVAGILANVLGGAIQILMPIVKFLLEAFVNLVGYLRGPLEVALGVVKGIFETLGGIIKGVLQGIGDFMKNPMGGIQDMLGIPQNSGGGSYSGGGVVGFAGGGVLGGYAPGRDTIPAMLSPGESVLVPELTRAIGPANIMALNAKFSGGRPAGAGPSPAVLRGAPAPSGGGTVYNVNVVVEGDGDPEEIKRAVKAALAEAAEETRRRAYA